MARAVLSGALLFCCAAALSPATRSPRAVVAAPRPPRRASVVAPRAHAVRAPPLEPARRDRVVVRAGDSEPESLFQKEKVGKLLFFLLPFALGVVDWINPELLHWF
mmetsp:Transcript_25010/g.75124  ORF Transcript_25010/g.75124 Transcript_25010/m.75124 type:complete len:106 (-) Transcript_25010:114-431(-)